MENRSTPVRIENVLARLAHDDNVWLATASPEGVPHLVPLSLAWVDDQVVCATPTLSKTVQNISQTPTVRLALESTIDVVVIDADARCIGTSQADSCLIEPYVSRVGWDPRDLPEPWSLIVIMPSRVQAWNSVNEMKGRTLMRDGSWTR